MKFLAALFLATVLEIAAAAGRGLRAVADTGSPVERVVILLKDMKSKLQQDEKVEQQIYNKYACWCETTSERKANNIENAQDLMRTISQQILSAKGRIETLESEIADLEKDIKENEKAQATATENRQKENGEFMSMQSEKKEAIAALEQAVTVLAEGTSLLQQKEQMRQGIAAVQRVMGLMPESASLKASQVSLLSDFLSITDSSKYAPQSGTIQGILKDMYDTFAIDLETATMDEAMANKDFESYMATKTEEVAEMQKSKAEKEKEKAEKEELLATLQSDFDDTEKQMKADIKFFDETKKACELKHEQWTTRSDMRRQEIEGIEKALEILTSDEARELFAKSITPGKETGADSFLQLSSSNTEAAAVAAQNRAYEVLRGKASQAQSLRLAALAVQVRTAKAGHFDKVIKTIDEIMAKLKKEGEEDVKKRDQCKDELFKIEKNVKQLEWEIKNNEAKIAKIDSEINELKEEKKETVKAIWDTDDEMKEMKKTRKAENEKFKQDKKDDESSIKLLEKAREVLGKYYKENEIDMGEVQGDVKGMFVQKQPEFEISADQAPEADFSSTGKRKNEAKGIVQILTYIIEDQQDEIKNDIKAEKETQEQFEKAYEAAKAYKEEMLIKKTDLEMAIADLDEQKTAENKVLEKNKFDLNDELDYKGEIKPDCDWILKAFEDRAKARAAEMDGLFSAKAALSGASFAQTSSKKGFDDTAMAKIGFLSLRH